jgi:hypothetical protein
MVVTVVRVQEPMGLLADRGAAAMEKHQLLALEEQEREDKAITAEPQVPTALTGGMVVVVVVPEQLVQLLQK